MLQGSSALRERVRKLARQRIGEGPALCKLDALIERARRASERRNRLLHDTWAGDANGDLKIRDDEGTRRPIPSAHDMDQLASDIYAITGELNSARLEGFLADALRQRPVRPPT